MWALLSKSIVLHTQVEDLDRLLWINICIGSETLALL